MRYVVLGAGAVGGVLGARMHLAGAEVVLVARGEHLAVVRERGLRLERPDGGVTVPVEAVGSPVDLDWREDDVLLLCVKSHQTGAALADLAGRAPVSTPVFCLQNGVGNEREALRLFERVHGVCVMMPTGHLEPGVVTQHSANSPGMLDVGRVGAGTDAADDESARKFARDVARAGFQSVVRPDVMAWKYRKLILNLGNAVDAAMRPGPAADTLRELARAEGERVLDAAGVEVVSAEIDRERRGDLLQTGPTDPRSGSSTWQSLTRGLPSEVDHLNGEIVLQGRLCGVPTPVNAALQAAAHAVTLGAHPVRGVDAQELIVRLG